MSTKIPLSFPSKPDPKICPSFVFLAQPATAARDKRGTFAKRSDSRDRRPSWKAQLNQLRLLLILSTFQPKTRQRLFLRTLLRCLVTRKYSGTRKLGRLFQTPSMNLSTTWTSRGWERGRNWTRSEAKLTSSTSSQNTLRLEQKTSGLFDTEQAGNPTVAGKASKLGLMLDDMDSYSSMVQGEALGELFQEIPAHLTEGDYLDSFMDLSNFLMPDEEMKAHEIDGVVVDNGDVKGDIDFSRLASHLDITPTVIADVDQIVTVATPSLGKRKLAEYLQMDCETVNVDGKELWLDSSVPDHDYVSKKPRLASNIEDVVPTPSTSKQATSGKAKDKYRERRDKNNVASRRSREIRKMKFVDMNKEADELEIKNEALRKKIDELENLAKIMKAELIKKMTEK